MWNPISLTIINVGPIAEATYNFNGPVLVEGDNQTDKGQETNGVGKSYFKESIRYAFSGDLFKSRLPLVEFLREGETEGSVTFLLENSMLKSSMEITRTFKLSSGKLVNKCKLVIDGKPEVHSSLDEYNKVIIELLGISKEDLYTYYILSKKEFSSFFDNSNTGKQKIISRFSGIEAINGIDKFIKTDQSHFEQQNQDVSREQSRIEGEINILKQNIIVIDDKLEKFEINKKKKIAELEKFLLEENDKLSGFMQEEDQIFDELHDLETDLKQVKIDIETAEKDIDNKEYADFVDISSKIKKFIQKEEKKLIVEGKNKAAMEILKAGDILCPKCKHSFILNKDISLEEVEKAIGELLTIIKNIEDEIEEGETDLKEVKEQIEIIQTKFQKVITFKEKKNTTNHKIGEYQELKREALEQGDVIEKIEEEIADWITRESETNKKEEEAKIQKQIDEKLNEIVKIKELVAKNEVKIQDCKMWLVYFKKFYTHLINKTLKTIEYQTNTFLEKMESILGISIEGYGVNQDGSIRDEISVFALKSGQNVGPFEKFSGGEEGRCVIANLLGYQQLINITSPSGGLNLLLMDEILGSVDSKGIESIIYPLLQELDRNVIVIDHIKHNLKTIPTLIIRKTNDIAHFIIE